MGIKSFVSDPRTKALRLIIMGCLWAYFIALLIPISREILFDIWFYIGACNIALLIGALVSSKTKPDLFVLMGAAIAFILGPLGLLLILALTLYFDTVSYKRKIDELEREIEDINVYE